MLRTLLHQTGVQQVQSMYKHRSKEKVRLFTCWSHQQLLVCAWRHGGVLVVRNKKRFSPLGTKLYFHVHSSKKLCCIDHQHNTNMAALWRGCKPRIPLGKTRMWKELECLSESRFKSKTAKQSVFLRIQVHCTHEQFNKSWKRRAKLERDARFFLPPHTLVGRVRLARFARVRILPCSFLL